MSHTSQFLELLVGFLLGVVEHEGGGTTGQKLLVAIHGQADEIRGRGKRGGTEGVAEGREGGRRRDELGRGELVARV
jgi:hypothetical protein